MSLPGRCFEELKNLLVDEGEMGGQQGQNLGEVGPLPHHNLHRSEMGRQQGQNLGEVGPLPHHNLHHSHESHLSAQAVFQYW